MDLSDFKISFLFITNSDKRHILCTCGYNGEIDQKDFSDHGCPECGNGKFKYVDRTWAKTLVAGHELEVLSKHDKGFHVRNTKVIAHFNTDKSGFKLKVGRVHEFEFDLRNKIVRYYSVDGGKKEKISEDSFYRNINMGDLDLIEFVSTPNSITLYKFAYHHLGSQYNERTKKLGRGLERLLAYPMIELFYSCGFKSIYSVYNMSKIYSYAKVQDMDHEKTLPHKILRIPKYALPYVKELSSFTKMYMENIRELDKEFGGNNVKLIWDILKEETTLECLFSISDYIIHLHKDYQYNDIKKLVLYLARDVKLSQGIDNPSEAATLLRDYVRMSTEMELEYDKYPKSLKKDHDIVKLNYKVRSDEKSIQQFRNVSETPEYTGLQYKKKDYSIVIPLSPDDLIKEGESLNHCVASYVKDVINDKCKILFLRPTASLDESLVTIEIRDNNIRQVKGRFNRLPGNEEMQFINKWSEEKGLHLAIH